MAENKKKSMRGQIRSGVMRSYNKTQASGYRMYLVLDDSTGTNVMVVPISRSLTEQGSDKIAKVFLKARFELQKSTIHPFFNYPKQYLKLEQITTRHIGAVKSDKLVGTLSDETMLDIEVSIAKLIAPNALLSIAYKARDTFYLEGVLQTLEKLQQAGCIQPGYSLANLLEISGLTAKNASSS